MKTTTLNYSIGSVIVLISLYYVYRNALHYFNFSVPQNSLDINSFRPFLLVHISAGMVAILGGPLQFVPALRNRYRHLHRILKKTYLLAILIGASSALYLAIYDNILTKKEMVFGTGVIGLAVAWLATSGMAFWAIKSQNISQHREWMVRSYIVTCGFTTFRLLFDQIYAYTHLAPEVLSGIVAWACWSVPLMLTEVVIQAQKLADRPSTRIREMSSMAT